ncbi:MAG: acyl carrier protein [Bacteroidales bacterium]|nr:acyl carrier protein [Bacteroidales bacterium]
MEINEFVEKVADLFEDTDKSEIQIDTKFKELDEWSSIMALNVIAMVDDEYDVLLRGDDIRTACTIRDLFNIANSKK